MSISKVLTKGIHLESILLLCVSCGLFAIRFTNLHLTILRRIRPSIAWEEYITGLGQLLLIYGLIIFIASILSFVYSRRDTTLSAQVARQINLVYKFLRQEILPSILNCFKSKSALIWLFLAILLGIVLGGFFINQPMRYDESYTFMRFINTGVIKLFYYPSPNNHVLYTLLAKVSTSVGGGSPIFIRLPAFVAGINSMLLLYCLCQRLNHDGILASLLFSVFPYLILYSTNGRGYTLLIFFTLAMVYVGMYIRNNPLKVEQAILLSIIAALGMLTMPSMLFSITGIFIWLLFILIARSQPVNDIVNKLALPFCVSSILLTILFYSPVILVSNGVAPIITNKYVLPLQWPEFSRALLPHLHSTINDTSRDIPRGAILAGLLVMLIGFLSFSRKRDLSAVLLLPLLLLGSAIILLLQHAIPFQRTWIFIIPFILIYIDAGFSFIVKRFSIPIRRAIYILCFGLCVVFAIRIMSTGAIAQYADTGAFPEAQIVANYLKSIGSSKDMVIALTPADYPTRYYLWYYGVQDNGVAKSAEPAKTYYVIKKSRYSVMDLTGVPVVKLLDIGDMQLYQSMDSADK